MRKSLFGGAVILMAAGIVARLFGFVYRIFLSNLIGAEGMGLYELIVPVYTAIVLTVTAGINITVSKMVAEQKARNNTSNPGRITMCALAMVFSAGAVISLIILFSADFFSAKVLGDERTYPALLVLAPCLSFVVSAAALKGYFYGLQQMVPTAVSQIAEQAVKMGILLLFSSTIAVKNAEYACTVAALSAALGEIANLLILYIIFAFRQKQRKIKRHSEKLLRKRHIIIEILKGSVPVSMNRLIISALSAVEFIMIPSMLVRGGMDEKSSMELFGRLTGMALPLIMFPSLVTNSLATTLVPAISESMSLKRFRHINHQISRSMKVTFILGIFFTSLFICFSDEIGALIYKREKIGNLIFMLSFSCVFIYLQQMLAGVMNGLGKQMMLLENTVIGSIIRIASAYFLIPAFGIESYILGMILSLIVTESLNIIVINKITGLIIDLREWMIKPALIGAVMVIAGGLFKHFFKMFHLQDYLITVLSIGTFGIAAFSLMIAAGILRPQEFMGLTGINLDRKKAKFLD